MNPIERERKLDHAKHAGPMGIDSVCGFDSPAMVYADAELYRIVTLAKNPEAEWDGATMGFSWQPGDSERWSKIYPGRHDMAERFLRAMGKLK